MRFLNRHRQAREASILHRLAKGEADIPTMVRAIYIGIDPRLTRRGRLFRAGASGRSGRARDRGDRWRSGDRRDVIRMAGFARVIPRMAKLDGIRELLHGSRFALHSPFADSRLRHSLRNDASVTSSPSSRGALAGACGFFTTGLALSTALLMSSISLVTRAALLPRSLSK